MWRVLHRKLECAGSKNFASGMGNQKKHGTILKMDIHIRSYQYLFSKKIKSGVNEEFVYNLRL